jgi:ribosomal protein L37AE/L43A
MIKFSDILLESSQKINCNHCGWSWKKSDGGKDVYVCNKCNHDNTPKSFDEFAEKRMGGATKITNSMKEKGGLSMLTYHHYVVKLPYYKKAAEGKFDIKKAKKEFNECIKQLTDDMEQIAFQKLVGRIEVLGELLIKHK